MNRKKAILSGIGGFVVTFVLITGIAYPIYNGKTGLQYIQDFLSSREKETSIEDEPLDNIFANFNVTFTYLSGQQVTVTNGNFNSILWDQVVNISIENETITALIGGSTSFSPSLTLYAEENASFSIGYDTPFSSFASFSNNMFQWTTSAYEFSFYPVNATEQHDGGFEYELTILRYIPISSITFPISYENVSLYYQGHLNETHQIEGIPSERPENIVESIAIYNKEKKVMHLYRPKAIDAIGNEIWCNMSLNLDEDTITISIDPLWLLTATYPVRIDPTFGYTSIGGTVQRILADLIALSNYTLADDNAIIDDIKVYGKGDGASANIKGLIYDNQTGVNPWYPYNKKAVGNAVTATTTAGWWTSSVGTTVMLDADRYWIGVVPNADYDIYYDNGDTAQFYYYRTAGQYSSPPDPFPSGGTARAWKMSVYVDYHLDTTPPTINIAYVGNISDEGSPHYVPPSESTTFAGAYTEGYYVNDSNQHEDWFLCRAQVTDDESVNKVYLHIYNVTTNTWYNTTEMEHDSGTIWQCYTTGNITFTPGHYYTLDIWANDTSGNENYVWWNKTGINGTITRRYVSLGCTPDDNITYANYSCYYFHRENYTEAMKADRLHHDQGGDGTINDTGYLLSELPGDFVHWQYCRSWIGWFFDENACIPDTYIYNMYPHFWWSSNSTDPFQCNLSGIGWNVTETYSNGKWEDVVQTNYSQGKSHIYYDMGITDTYLGVSTTLNNNFSLFAGKLMPLTTLNRNFTDNSIFNFTFGYSNTKDTGFKQQYPVGICNRSFLSFILFNVPDNATLNASYGDTDNDGLSDWTELYETYTHPFLSDTDNDGISDYWEWRSGSDPNNWTESYNVSWKVVNNSISGTVYNQSSWHIIDTTINGTVFNQSSWTIIDNAINGTVFNQSSWHTIDNTISGTVYNQSSWNIIDNSISGTVFNTSSFTIVNDSISGTVYNQSSWHIIDNTISGTVFNSSVPEWVIINDTISGTVFNGSSWHIIDTAINGTVFNGTGEGPPITLSDEYPANGSTKVELQPTLVITVTNRDGKQMNISWYYGNSSANTTHLYTTTSGNANGTYSQPHFTATNYTTEYWWRVYVSDGTTHINETFNFTTKSSFTGGFMPITGMANGILSGLIAGSIALLFAVAISKRRSRKRKWRRRRVPLH